jgi:hypothetical protein
MTSNLLGFLIAINLQSNSLTKDVVTSNKEQGYFIVSSFPERTGFDATWFARKTRNGSEKLVQLPSKRYDRDLPDEVHLNGKTAVVRIYCAANILFEIFFLMKTVDDWTMVQVPEYLTIPLTFGDIHHNKVLHFGDYSVGTIWNGEEGPMRGTYLWSFTPRALKLARLAYPEGEYELKVLGSKSFQLTLKKSGSVPLSALLPNGTLGLQQREKVMFPPSIKNGFWVR